MEIIKTNENYSISDVYNTWKISGMVTVNSNGDLHINAEITNDLEDKIGNVFYNHPIKGNVSFGCNNILSFDKIDDLMSYTKVLINQVLEQFKNK